MMTDTNADPVDQPPRKNQCSEAGEDDSLTDNLLQHNAAFQALLAESEASPRKPFVPGSED